MEEKWRPIPDFPGYHVSSDGNIKTDKFSRNLALSQNQYGVVQVGLFKDGVQHHRSVPLLVAKAFIARKFGAFDTPINLDGDRWNNSVENLAWRPRWFAIKYNQQFKFPVENPIEDPIEDVETGVLSENSLDCATTYGLLEEDLIESIQNRTYVWPTYQQFRIVVD